MNIDSMSEYELKETLKTAMVVISSQAIELLNAKNASNIWMRSSDLEARRRRELTEHIANITNILHEMYDVIPEPYVEQIKNWLDAE